MIRRPPISPLFPYTTLSRSDQIHRLGPDELLREPLASFQHLKETLVTADPLAAVTTILTNLREAIARVLERLSLETLLESPLDRKSTRLNSSHLAISYAVFC